jgi:DNA-binding MarR family transcriptional regulator
MMPSLRDELRQTKPFASLEEEALLSIVRTSAVLMDQFERLLRPYRITATQYNVLRILRGSEPHGLSRNELRDRMLTRMPDVTRLLDRMEGAGLVARVRGEEDRRLVTTRITKSALATLAELDPIVVADHTRRFRCASDSDLRSLIKTLAGLRASAAS